MGMNEIHIDVKETELPKGWTLATIAEVVEPVSSYKPEDEPDREFGYVDISSICNVTYQIKDYKRFKGVNAPSRARRPIHPNDIVFSNVRTYLRNIAIVPIGLDVQLCSTGFTVLRPNGAVEPQFLFRYVITKSFIDRLTPQQTGTHYPATSDRVVMAESLLLPPLNEQRRIVAKLEKLLSKVDSCKERLDKIPAILKRFRQSVLSAACSGRLTADWRENNPDVESAEELLKRIQEERENRYKDECEKAKAEGRRKPTSFRENIETIELSQLPLLPSTWRWERLVNTSNIIGGVAKGRHLGNRPTTMLPYLRVANVQDGFLDLTEIKEIEALPEDLEKYHLQDGDMLFTEGGDRDKLGRGTVWRNNIKNCIHQNHIYRARLYYASVSSDYISLATKSDYARAYFLENANQTVNLASINLTSLGNVPLAIPPLAEQQEIVNRVQTLFKTADRIEQRYQKARTYIDQLTQSILAKAFRGELVPQDPNDEPASVLLERIRAERENRENVAKTAKKPAANKKQRSKKAQPQLEPTPQLEPIQLELPLFD